MAYWLYPANTKFYDVLGAFSRKSTYWPVKSNVAVGDTLLLYLAAPYKQIGFEAEVAQIDLEPGQVLDKLSPFFKNMPDKKENKTLFMKLININPIALDKDTPLGLDQLKHAGLRGMLMGPRNLDNNPKLLDYIKGRL